MNLDQQLKPTKDEATLIIFGTSIDSKDKERNVLQLLCKIEGIEDVSIDMEDWEHVLRIACKKPISIRKVMRCIESLDICCYELADN